eukprot:TRINITY_DN9162_c0_g1_i2.p1 TRINITY_DN9162_c0_g1~~TRINITY_DN9162_c0_g1_i2.p1  ORF type:complete len:508 (-),score=116.55 TRINITY_DN9162_c0_g1_i2:247-1770(-)
MSTVLQRTVSMVGASDETAEMIQFVNSLKRRSTDESLKQAVKRARLPTGCGVSGRRAAVLEPVARQHKPRLLAKQTVAKDRLRQRQDTVLQELCAVLRALTPEQRRAALVERFTHTQRAALERWMLSHGHDNELLPRATKAAASKPAGNLVGKAAERCGGGMPHSRVSSEGQQPEEPRARKKTMPECTKKKRPAVTHFKKALWVAAPWRLKERRGAAGRCEASQKKDANSHCEEAQRGLLCNVSPSTGVRYYNALISIGMLRLASRKCRDREVALRHHEALRAIRLKVAQMAGTFEARVRRAIDEVTRDHGLCLKELGLRLSVSFWAHRWVAQPLRTPSIPAEDEQGLSKALRAWRSLHDARQELLTALDRAAALPVREDAASTSEDCAIDEETAAWSVLKKTFLDVEEGCGRSRQKRSERLAEAEARVAPALAKSRYKRQHRQDKMRRQGRRRDEQLKQKAAAQAARKGQRIATLLRRLDGLKAKLSGKPLPRGPPRFFVERPLVV